MLIINHRHPDCVRQAISLAVLDINANFEHTVGLSGSAGSMPVNHHYPMAGLYSRQQETARLVGSSRRVVNLNRDVCEWLGVEFQDLTG
jgi:hypothetical protein